MFSNKIRVASYRCYSCTPCPLRAGLGLPTDLGHNQRNKMQMHNETNIFNTFVSVNYRTALHKNVYSFSTAKYYHR